MPNAGLATRGSEILSDDAYNRRITKTIMIIVGIEMFFIMVVLGLVFALKIYGESIVQFNVSF